MYQSVVEFFWFTLIVETRIISLRSSISLVRGRELKKGGKEKWRERGREGRGMK